MRANRSTTQLKLVVLFKNDKVTAIAEPEVLRRSGEFSPSDTSPAAIAAGRARFEAAQAQAKQVFFAFGYYLGKVSGSLEGSLTLSVCIDGTVSAVIQPDVGSALLVDGQFDTASSDAMRSLTLNGSSPQGVLSLIGHINLKDRTLQGRWTATSIGANSSSTGGSFTASR